MSEPVVIRVGGTHGIDCSHGVLPKGDYYRIDDTAIVRALAIAAVVDEAAAGNRKRGPQPVAQMRTAQIYIDQAEARMAKDPEK